MIELEVLVILLFFPALGILESMPRKASGHVKFMVMLPAALVKTIKRVAGEKRQTYSAVAEEWLLKGQAEHEARKAER